MISNNQQSASNKLLNATYSQQQQDSTNESTKEQINETDKQSDIEPQQMDQTEPEQHHKEIKPIDQVYKFWKNFNIEKLKVKNFLLL